MTETQRSAAVEPWLADLAEAITRRGLAVPATLLLETMRPFGFLGSQLVLMLAPLGGTRASLWLHRTRCLLEQPQHMDALLHLLAGRDDSPAVDG
ncbi:MAG: hypothetical protein V1772_04935 [Chloroflexota bacterium]